MKVAIAPSVTALDISEAESDSTRMLLALAATGKHNYAGTVPPAVKATRRRRNRAARIARRARR